MDVAQTTQQATEGVQQIVQTLKKTDFISIAMGLGVLIVGIIVVKILIKMLDKYIKNAAVLNPTAWSLMRATLRFSLYFIVVMLSANMMGIPTTSFIAMFSIIGLAASLAVQGILSSVAGGIILMVSKPFNVGDVIEANSLIGKVIEVGFLQTKIEAPDGKKIYIPNSSLYTSNVINYTVNGRRRIELSVCASYRNSPEEVRKAVMSEIEKDTLVLKDPGPEVFVEEYAESQIEYKIFLWVEPDNYLAVRYSVNEKLYHAFANHGIAMDYPHMNVHFMEKNEK